MPTLLRTRPLPLQAVLAGIIPIAYGALCGWLLTVNKTLYTIAALLAIVGAYVAGQEHEGALQGALRGLVGGALFGGALLIVFDAIDKPAKTSLPHPNIIVLGISIVVGVVCGALGGRRRAAREEEEEKEKAEFKLSRIKRSELIGFVGAIVLAVSLFAMPWFSTSCSSNKEAVAAQKQVGGCNSKSKLKLASGKVERGTFTAWQTYKILRWLLLLSCIAPFILAYIIARGHELSWRPGEVTMIVGILAFALILLDGIILGRPGANSEDYVVDVSIEWGYPVALAAAFCLAYGGFRRQAEDAKPQPPGV